MLSIFLNDSKLANNNSNPFNSTSGKVDCAKECPCGVPVIPVPDQWLEVMVTGGFKVWHIIFIIIAVMITMTVVYCCFHRCRIPRTKQEIEADLMRSNLTNKFRDYLQELSNEPTTFVEALKKVQDLEEKLEKDEAMLSRDLGARKRMGWLKLKGKDEKAPAVDNNDDQAADKTTDKLAANEQVGDVIKPDDNKQDPSQVVVVPNEPELMKPQEGINVDMRGQQEDGRKDGADELPEVKSVAASLGRQSRRPRRHKPNLSRSKRAKEKSQGEPADFEARHTSQGEQQVDPTPAPAPASALSPSPAPAPPLSLTPPSPEPLNPGGVVKKERHHKLHRRHKAKKEPKTVANEAGDTGIG